MVRSPTDTSFSLSSSAGCLDVREWGLMLHEAIIVGYIDLKSQTNTSSWMPRMGFITRSFIYDWTAEQDLHSIGTSLAMQ